MVIIMKAAVAAASPERFAARDIVVRGFGFAVNAAVAIAADFTSVSQTNPDQTLKKKRKRSLRTKGDRLWQDRPTESPVQPSDRPTDERPAGRRANEKQTTTQ